ncbi:MAG: hypothetical protein U0837_08470 [Dehalococcoidia bacterium]
MNASLSLSPRRLFMVGALCLVAAATVGYANTNTVPGSNAGDGSGAISGYVVTNVHYNLDGTNPNNTTSVTFTVNTAIPNTATKRLSLDGGTTWLLAGACSGTTNISCTAAVPVLSLTNLRLVAAD